MTVNASDKESTEAVFDGYDTIFVKRHGNEILRLLPKPSNACFKMLCPACGSILR